MWRDQAAVIGFGATSALPPSDIFKSGVIFCNVSDGKLWQCDRFGIAIVRIMKSPDGEA